MLKKTLLLISFSCLAWGSANALTSDQLNSTKELCQTTVNNFQPRAETTKKISRDQALNLSRELCNSLSLQMNSSNKCFNIIHAHFREMTPVYDHYEVTANKLCDDITNLEELKGL